MLEIITTLFISRGWLGINDFGQIGGTMVTPNWS